MKFYGTTDVGQKRTVNQDNFIIKEYSPDVTLAVVCDGMGGANGGGLASRIAVEAFCGLIDDHKRFLCEKYGEQNSDEKICDILQIATEEANDKVFAASEEDEELHGMGTTLVAAVITPRAIYAVNVGDSRMYHIYEGNAIQVTKDHSYVQYLVDMGKMSPRAAKKSDKKNIITRAVGTDPSTEADVYTVPRNPAGGFVILCSDGLHNLTETKELADAVKHRGKVTDEILKSGGDSLVSLANKRGGNDNITVAILYYEGSKNG